MLEFPLVFYYNRIVLTNADVAQAVEHFIGNEEVGGPIPLNSLRE